MLKLFHCITKTYQTLKLALKPFVLKLFGHIAKTNFSASFSMSFSQLLLKLKLKQYMLKLFRCIAKTFLAAVLARVLANLR